METKFEFSPTISLYILVLQTPSVDLKSDPTHTTPSNATEMQPCTPLSPCPAPPPCPHSPPSCRWCLQWLKEVMCFGCTSEGSPISTLLTPDLLVEALQTHRSSARCHGMCWDCTSQQGLQPAACRAVCWAALSCSGAQACARPATRTSRGAGVTECTARHTEVQSRRNFSCQWIKIKNVALR